MIWLVVGTWWLSIYWECHHPNWRTHIFQRGRYTTNQWWILRMILPPIVMDLTIKHWNFIGIKYSTRKQNRKRKVRPPFHRDVQGHGSVWKLCILMYKYTDIPNKNHVIAAHNMMNHSVFRGFPGSFRWSRHKKCWLLISQIIPYYPIIHTLWLFNNAMV